MKLLLKKFVVSVVIVNFVRYLFALITNIGKHRGRHIDILKAFTKARFATYRNLPNYDIYYCPN